MSNSPFTLNDVLGRASVTTPCLSAENFQEIYLRTGSRVCAKRQRPVFALVNEFSHSCLPLMGMEPQLLPLISAPLHHLALVFGYQGGEGVGRYSGRGVCDSNQRTMVFFVPSELDRWFFQEILYKTDEVHARFLLALRVSARKTVAHSATLACMACFSTHFQHVLERALRNLTKLIAHEDSPDAVRIFRAELFTDLCEIKLEKRMEELISLARSGEHNHFVTICDILTLKKEEREKVAEVWLSALKGKSVIQLPVIARRQFTANLFGSGKGVGWDLGRVSTLVPDRFSHVSPFMNRLECVVDQAAIVNLVNQVVRACGSLCEDPRTWRELASHAVMATLNQERGPFRLS